ncbi:MAG: nicotinamide-nucleotide amidohydrolase family protein [Neisseria sp.]|nr:nicotinamide-nucleotide amidohydrolase family protein [Neisseria sp.]
MDCLQRIADYFTTEGLKAACAESCTGGLLAAAFTELPGSSAWFDMGWVTYSNEAKEKLLGVRAETLRDYGAVSGETVREMALGALVAAKADFAVSISGIAGPGGGSDDKPVGTVWFGVADKRKISAHRRQFDGSRNEIREQAVRYALYLLADAAGVPLDAPFSDGLR